MSDYPNKRFGGPKRFDRGDSRPPFRGGDRSFGGPKEMFDAECANCHKMTQVPFKPNGMKPVYCRDCFKPDETRGGDRPRFEKREFAPRPSFNREAPSAPMSARPDSRIDELKRQMDTMNATLQHLVSVIEKQNQKAELGSEVRKALVPTAPVKKAVKKAKKK